MSHCKEVCRSSKGSTVHNIEIEDEKEQGTDIELVNTNSIRFNANHSPTIANLKTSLNKVAITVPYKVDIGGNGNILPFYIYKTLFPRATVEQLAVTKDTKFKVKTCNQSSITQLSICRATLKIITNAKYAISL